MYRKTADDYSYEEDTTQHSFTVSPEERDEVKEMQQLALRETRQAAIYKKMFLFLFQVVPTFATTFAYLYLDTMVIEHFRSSYRQATMHIEESVTNSVENIFKASEGIGGMIAAHAVSSQSEWPFVSLPNFEASVHHLRELSKAELVVFAPLVPQKALAMWSNYSKANQHWIDESHAELGEARNSATPIPAVVHDSGEDQTSLDRPSLPHWQMSPPPKDPGVVNLNSISMNGNKETYEAMIRVQSATLGPIEDNPHFDIHSISIGHNDKIHTARHGAENDHTFIDAIHSAMMVPIFATKSKGHTASVSAAGKEIVGTIISYIGWQTLLRDSPVHGKDSLYVVLQNDNGQQGQQFTYLLSEKGAACVGEGDHHDKALDKYQSVVQLFPLRREADAALDEEKESDHQEQCAYRLFIYPSLQMFHARASRIPYAIAMVIALSSMLMTVSFMAYDHFVQLKSKTIINAAAQSGAIVSSLFPENVRERFFHHRESAKSRQRGGLKSFLADGAEGSQFSERSKQIADLYPDSTVMFADLVGFTAWSSVREPCAVFSLLETLYSEFDQLAEEEGVFKIETIGDCYLAVTGLPEPRKDHAVAMAKFASRCLKTAHTLFKELEVTLGPDTGDLAVRIGMHSGPVTAGVLRGERARFQLFGDTVNTASRMESTGKGSMIHLSTETADLLRVAGKGHWISPRSNKIVAKGKGEMTTYWLKVKPSSGSSTRTLWNLHARPTLRKEIQSVLGMNEFDSGERREKTIDELDNSRLLKKYTRLIDWSVEVLGGLLRKVVRQRQTSGKKQFGSFTGRYTQNRPNNQTILDEVSEIISLPDFERMIEVPETLDSVELDEKVVRQLRDLVHSVAFLYRDNPFHNFEHASHVTMSVIKLLSRTIAPTGTVLDPTKQQQASDLLDRTSDPLTQFACVFAALIHDIDHAGLPNTHLMRENPELASTYKNKSIAEQNSVDVAWSLFMDDAYADLRSAIFTAPDEMHRFRQLVVNSVMATDIMDKDVVAWRNARWQKAFAGTSIESSRDTANRKATIVVEHLIQASDVAHTMQHWHVYRKWNERLFLERSLAYHQGRASDDPAKDWYQAELTFFDTYVIPLAKKLQECGVFGVSSDEYLNYAMKNRLEWEQKGQKLVSKMMEKTSQILMEYTFPDVAAMDADGGNDQPTFGMEPNNVEAENVMPLRLRRKA